MSMEEQILHWLGDVIKKPPIYSAPIRFGWKIVRSLKFPENRDLVVSCPSVLCPVGDLKNLQSPYQNVWCILYRRTTHRGGKVTEDSWWGSESWNNMIRLISLDSGIIYYSFLFDIFNKQYKFLILLWFVSLLGYQILSVSLINYSRDWERINRLFAGDESFF